jgi:CIC family chloride channel protein
VGMAAIFAGSAHAPITAILILFEMTDDYQIMLPLMIAVVIAHLVASALDPDSIYSVKLRRLGGLTPTKSAPSVLDLVLVADATSTDYLTVSQGMILNDLARRLHDTRRRCAVVVDPEGKLAGIVTVRDVESALVEGDGDAPVDEVMTRNLLTCTPDQHLRDVADTIRDQDLGQVPVVDKNDPKKLVGMLRRRELLWAYGELASEHDRLLEQANPEAIPESRREHDAVLLDVELSTKHEKICFKKIRDLSVPNEFRVAFVRRAGRTMVPLGNTVVEPGDVLVMLSTLDDEARMRQWVAEMTATG